MQELIPTVGLVFRSAVAVSGNALDANSADKPSDLGASASNLEAHEEAPGEFTFVGPFATKRTP
jgi:hypothetical protein